MTTTQQTTANDDIRWRCRRRVKELNDVELLVLFCTNNTVTLDVRHHSDEEPPDPNYDWITGRRRTIDAVGGNAARVTADSPYVDGDARTLIAPRASPIVPSGWRGAVGMIESNVLAPVLSDWWRPGRRVVSHDRGLPDGAPAPSKLLQVIQQVGGQAVLVARRVVATPDRIRLAIKNLAYVYQPEELAFCDRSAFDLQVWKQLAAGCDVFRVEVRVSSEELWTALIQTTRAISWERVNGPSAVERRLARAACTSAEELRQFPLLFTESDLLDTMVALLRR